MKKTNIQLFVIALFVVMIAGLVSAAEGEYEYISEGDILTASLINQNPDPAIAGNLVELRIGVENWGSTPAEDYELEIVMDYPFQAVSGEQYIRNTGNLQGFQTREDQKILKFRIRTDREAEEDSYPLHILLYKAGQKNVAAVKKTLYVDVKNRESAEVIYIDKVKLIPGKQTPLEFTINNVGAAPLRDMSFSWSNAEDIILPVGSSDTKYVKFLGIGEKTTITYDVIADTNADPGLYKLDLSLSYEDPITGSETNISANAGIYVGGVTDFDVAFSENANGQVSFSISNIGSNPANSVSVIVSKQEGWKVTGPDAVIIGNLNKGDYTVASYALQSATVSKDTSVTTTKSKADLQKMTEEEKAELKKKRVGSEPQTVKIDIAYTDTMGERNVVSKEVNLNPSMLESSAGLMSGRGVKASPTDNIKKYALYGLVVLLLIVGYYAYKRFTGKKGKKK